MNKQIVFTRILAIAGTVLVGLPVAFPVVLALVLMISQHVFLFDYLMPAEFFPVVFAGTGLLIWAVLRAHLFARSILWAAGAALGLLMLGQEFGAPHRVSLRQGSRRRLAADSGDNSDRCLCSGSAGVGAAGHPSVPQHFS